MVKYAFKYMHSSTEHSILKSVCTINIKLEVNRCDVILSHCQQIVLFHFTISLCYFDLGFDKIPTLPDKV